MNGIGLLIIVAAYILVWIGYVRIIERNTWRNWDRNRRYDRKLFRYDFKECQDEVAYRHQLRHIVKMKRFSSAMKNIQIATNTTTEAVRNSNESLRKVVEIMTWKDKETSQEKLPI